jgi:hypothetical protein
VWSCVGWIHLCSCSRVLSIVKTRGSLQSHSMQAFALIATTYMLHGDDDAGLPLPSPAIPPTYTEYATSRHQMTRRATIERGTMNYDAYM